MSILEGLVSESSSITDETLQIGGMECVLVLSRGCVNRSFRLKNED